MEPSTVPPSPDIQPRSSHFLRPGNPPKAQRFGASIAFAMLILLFAPPSPAAHKAIYVAGGLFNGQVASLRSSDFDTAILWSLHVNGAGALVLNNDTLINASGNYVYGQWARDNCALLKQAPTSISRIEFSVGSAGATDFENIENLVNTNGTGPGSILRRNFQALRDAFPQVDAINFDDESNYDLSTTTAFAIMLVDLGYQITFAPYTAQNFWGNLYNAIEAQRPGAVDHVYLQVYAGGALNVPATWNPLFGSLKVEPGLWAGAATTSGRRDPSEVESDMNAWKANADIPGGFIWRLSYTTEGGFSAPDYAAAIEGTYTSEFDDTVYYKCVNQFSGKALAALDENIAGVPADGTLNGGEVAQGHFLVHDHRYHWTIEDLGNGFRKITNRYSGKSLAVFGTHLDGVTPVPRTDNFAEVAQWEYSGNAWYQWRLTDTGAGYKIINRHSNRAATVFGNNTAGGAHDRSAHGAEVAQYQYLGQPWYHWNIVVITPPMQISAHSPESGLVEVTVAGGEPARIVTLESSPSMGSGSWIEEGTMIMDSSGQADFTLLMPSGDRRFYRAFETTSLP